MNRRWAPFVARSSALGESASLAELAEGDLIPGREGVTLTDRTIRFGDVFRLTDRTGIEYALTRETIDGGRAFRLYSGGRNAVSTPRRPDVRLIGHTHPSGIGVPSLDDIEAINRRFLDAIERDQFAPVPHPRVIFGRGATDSTIFFPTLFR